MLIRSAKDLGLLVRDRRKQLKLTQDELARRLGVGRLWVLQLERGKPTAQLGLVLAALNDLGIPLQIAPPEAKTRRDQTIDLDRIIHGSTGRKQR